MSQPIELAPDDGSDGLYARARGGDQAAWRALVDRCDPKVRRAIRRRLNSCSMRSLYDSTDFMGDVWKSLAERQEELDFPTVEKLIAFLATAAERKVIDEHRRLHALRRDMSRDRPMAACSGDAGGGPPSLDPTASQVAQAGEAREQLFSGQTGEDRQVLDLKDRGFSNEEIARLTGWNVRRVQRFFKDLAESWGPRVQGGRR